jgi:aldehyde dehydrogenase (NAD+)
LEYRRAQLLALARLTQDNAEALLGALHSDLGRHKFEGNIAEISPPISACIHAANSLEEWMKSDKPQVEEWRSSYNTTIYKAPKGVVIIIV